MTRYSPSVREKIKQRYWPRVDANGKLVEPADSSTRVYSAEQQALEYDPNTVWVGPLIDGLVELGIFTGPSKKQARHSGKVFFYESADKGTELFELIISRCEKVKGEWPYAGAKYGKEFSLRTISGIPTQSVEPGDIRNSPAVVRETDDIWEQRPQLRDFEPEILIDKRYGLHILYRGDKLMKRYRAKARNGKMVTYTDMYVLRPSSEGPSLVPSVRADPNKIVV